MYLSSGLLHTISEKVRGKMRTMKKGKDPVIGGRRHSQLWFTLCVVIFMVMSLFLTSCVALIYDAVQGWEKGSGETHTLTVNYNYSGSRSISSSTPLYIASFGYDFTGDDPDLVYVSDPLTQHSGTCEFPDLDEMSYGVLVFVDENSNAEPDFGEVYQFYNETDLDPDEIFLNASQAITVDLTDSYIWFDAFYEDFEDGLMSEKWVDDGSGRWSLFAGAGDSDYRMQYSGMTGVSFIYYDAVYADFVFEVEVMQCSGNMYSQYGVFFRSSNPAGYGTATFSGYELRIDSSSNWSLIRWDSGPVTIMYGRSLYLSSGMNTPDLLRIECYADTITVYFNGYYVDSKTDGIYPSGAVGLLAEDDGSSNVFAFDNISVMK
jgi:hypothetical protein